MQVPFPALMDLHHSLNIETPPVISRGEESLPVQEICARYRFRPTRACWNNRSVARPAEHFRGEARPIGTFPQICWAVRCRATALRSPHRHFCLEQKLQHEVDVTQLVSYNPHTLAFIHLVSL